MGQPNDVCVICEVRGATRVGVLCERCAASLDAGDRAPGIVSSNAPPGDAAAWLIDAWGQLHPISARCTIGRDRATNELVLADLTISAEHAELRREQTRWHLRDRGSANGSGIDRERRTRSTTVKHGQRVWFGVLSFFMWDRAAPPAQSVSPPDVRTLIPAPSSFHLVAPPHPHVLEVHAVEGYPIDHAPGELVYVAKRTALPRLQFQLMRALCEAADENSSVGLRSHELLARLPFQTTRPEATHVRQVVSTLRAALERVGVPGGRDAGPDGIIHASERLGYRLTWSVRRASRGE